MNTSFAELKKDKILENRYKIIRLLKKGGQGAVYEAEDLAEKSRVAVKQIFLDIDDGPSNEELIDAFKHEAFLLKTLNHSSVPKVIEDFNNDDGFFFVMEIIEGDDLLNWLFPKIEHNGFIVEVVNIIIELLIIVEYLHSKEIIHRDIKPGNLKITKEGRLKLLDFGLSKGNAKSEISVTVFTRLKGGTPGYASLEQLNEQKTDPRSDIYSVGATAYKMLTKQTPPDAHVRITEISLDSPDPLIPANKINTQIPRKLTEILSKAMELKPIRRFPSATAMREELDVLLDEIQPKEISKTLQIRILSQSNFKAGERRILQFHVFREQKTIVTDVFVLLKIICSHFRPLIFHAKTDAHGIATFNIQLPYFRSGRGAIVVKAIVENEEAEIRQIIRNN